MNDLGPLRYFLGIEFIYSPWGYLLYQSKYIVSILAQIRLSDTYISNIPIELNVKYTSSDVIPLFDSTMYPTIISNIICLTITCPNIAYALHVELVCFSYYSELCIGSCYSHSEISSWYSILESPLSFIIFVRVVCLFWCWLGWWP